MGCGSPHYKRGKGGVKKSSMNVKKKTPAKKRPKKK